LELLIVVFSLLVALRNWLWWFSQSIRQFCIRFSVYFDLKQQNFIVSDIYLFNWLIRL